MFFLWWFSFTVKVVSLSSTRLFFYLFSGKSKYLKHQTIINLKSKLRESNDNPINDILVYDVGRSSHFYEFFCAAFSFPFVCLCRTNDLLYHKRNTAILLFQAWSPFSECKRSIFVFLPIRLALLFCVLVVQRSAIVGRWQYLFCEWTFSVSWMRDRWMSKQSSFFESICNSVCSQVFLSFLFVSLANENK